MSGNDSRLGLMAGLLLAALCCACAATDTTLSGTPTLLTARAALAGGAPELALTVCTNLLAQRAKDPALLVCRGNALTALGRNAEAIAAFEAALVVDKRDGAAKLGLGRIALASDPARAEALFLDALTSNPRDPAALNNLGIARDLQGHHLEAQAAYGEAIAAAPDDRAAQVNLALSMAMTGRTGEAVRLLRPIAGRQDATARERHDLAAVLTMDGKPDEAGRLLRADMDGAQADQALSGYEALQRR